MCSILSQAVKDEHTTDFKHIFTFFSFCFETYAAQKLTIDDEEVVAIDRNVQTSDLRQQLLLCVVELLIIANPEDEFLDVYDQLRFLE